MLSRRMTPRAPSGFESCPQAKQSRSRSPRAVNTIRFGGLNSTHVKTAHSDQRPVRVDLVGKSESVIARAPAACPACPGRAAGSRRQLPPTPRVADGPARRRGFIKRSNRGTFACARSPPVYLYAPSLKRSSSLFHRLFLDRLASTSPCRICQISVTRLSKQSGSSGCSLSFGVSFVTKVTRHLVHHLLCFLQALSSSLYTSLPYVHVSTEL